MFNKSKYEYYGFIHWVSGYWDSYRWNFYGQNDWCSITNIKYQELKGIFENLSKKEWWINNNIKNKVMERIKRELITQDIRKISNIIQSSSDSSIHFVDFQPIKFKLDSNRDKFISKLDFNLKFFKKIEVNIEYDLQSKSDILDLIEEIFKKYKYGMDQYLIELNKKCEMKAANKIKKIIQDIKNSNKMNAKILKLPPALEQSHDFHIHGDEKVLLILVFLYRIWSFIVNELLQELKQKIENDEDLNTLKSQFTKLQKETNDFEQYRVQQIEQYSKEIGLDSALKQYNDYNEQINIIINKLSVEDANIEKLLSTTNKLHTLTLDTVQYIIYLNQRLTTMITSISR